MSKLELKLNPYIDTSIILNEPNFKMFKYNKDHICVVIRQPYGHYCGYVGVRKESKLYGLDYHVSEVEYDDETMNPIDIIISEEQKGINDISVHGGLTYAGEAMSAIEDIFGNHYWFFGFDCAHYGDARILDIVSFDSSAVYRDYKYVEEQVKNLSNQLKEIEERNEER